MPMRIGVATNSPSAFVFTVVRTFVSVWMSTTVAAGMADPLPSNTCPVIIPVSCWAMAVMETTNSEIVEAKYTPFHAAEYTPAISKNKRLWCKLGVAAISAAVAVSIPILIRRPTQPARSPEASLGAHPTCLF